MALPRLQLRNQRHVLLDRVVREQSDILDRIADMTAQPDHVPCGGIDAIHQNGALVRHQQAIDQLEGGCFAGAAASEQHESFATPDQQAEIRDQSAVMAEPVMDVRELDRCFWRIAHRWQALGSSWPKT